jgi:hypothetical protein
MSLESLDSLQNQVVVCPFDEDLVKIFKVKILHCN